MLGARLARASGREILDEALRAFSGYHTTPVLEPRGDDLVLADTRLIFYYQNRLAPTGSLGSSTPIAPKPASRAATPPRERSPRVDGKSGYGLR